MHFFPRAIEHPFDMPVQRTYERREHDDSWRGYTKFCQAIQYLKNGAFMSRNTSLNNDAD